MNSVAIVPAAGEARRFGGNKLLADVGGRPLIDRTLTSLLDAGVPRVIVVTAPDATFEGSRCLEDPRVEVVVNPQPARGMFSSIQTGINAAAGATLLIVLPADMPFVKSQTVGQVLAHASDEAVVVPTHDGRRGHPIAIPALLRSALLEADPGRSLKDALAASGATTVALPVQDPGILRDVDVREDLS